MLKKHFEAEGGDVELIRWRVIGDDKRRPTVTAHVSSHRVIDSAQTARLAEQLKDGLGKPVQVTVTQVQAVSPGASDKMAENQ